jgi:hypothetical protein
MPYGQPSVADQLPSRLGCDQAISDSGEAATLKGHQAEPSVAVVAAGHGGQQLMGFVLEGQATPTSPSAYVAAFHRPLSPSSWWRDGGRRRVTGVDDGRGDDGAISPVEEEG